MCTDLITFTLHKCRAWLTSCLDNYIGVTLNGMAIKEPDVAVDNNLKTLGTPSIPY